MQGTVMMLRNDVRQLRRADDKTAMRQERSDSSSGDRLLAVLALFTTEQPEWSVEAAAAKLGVSPTTAYRYFRRLTLAGLISPVSGASYTLGPAIIEMDRLIQLGDPMLRVARDVMANLIRSAEEGATILLCRLFHDRVMCVHQIVGQGPQEPVSYERGRLMPLFRGATSKIILAHLPVRTLRSIFVQHGPEITAAGLGVDWDEFHRGLTALRRAGVSVTHGDVDAGRVGIAAPVFDANNAILGSLSFVLPSMRADDALIGRISALTTASAREIERGVHHLAGPSRSGSARVRVVR
jgi:DNA-binding IclR family transcriptional regulator